MDIEPISCRQQAMIQRLSLPTAAGDFIITIYYLFRI